MHDFPDWFIDFANEQLKNFPQTVEYFESKSTAEVQIEYIKVWSVIEIFAKIVKVLADKRAYLNEIKPKLEQFATAKSRLDECVGQLIELINFYETELRGEESFFQFTNVQAFKNNIKSVEYKKFSVSKNVVVQKNLPNKEEIEKSLRALAIDPPNFADFLNSKDKKSLYYFTRNQIAHQGIADVSKQTLIKNRLLSTMKISIEIRDYIEKVL